MCHANIYFGDWHVYSEKFRKSGFVSLASVAHAYCIFNMLNSHMHSNYYCSVDVFSSIYEKQKCVMLFECVLQVKSFHFAPLLSHLQVAPLHLSKPRQIWSDCTFKLFFFSTVSFFQNDLFISSAYVVKATVFPWARSCEKADSCFFPLKFGWHFFQFLKLGIRFGFELFFLCFSFLFFWTCSRPPTRLQYLFLHCCHQSKVQSQLGCQTELVRAVLIFFLSFTTCGLPFLWPMRRATWSILRPQEQWRRRRRHREEQAREPGDLPTWWLDVVHLGGTSAAGQHQRGTPWVRPRKGR